MRRLTTIFLTLLALSALVAAPVQARVRDRDTAGSVHGPALVGAPMIRVPPPPGVAPLSVQANQSSANWGGYVAATSLDSSALQNSVSDVVGTWVVPTVTGGTVDAYAADWVGIDGFLSNSVEQLGTEEDWLGGAPSYSAWWEMYPAPSQTISMAIHPGDVMTAEVKWLSGNTYSLSLKDVTTGASFSTQQTLSSAATRNSAEWIHEAPSSATQILPLTQTTPVTYTGCSATISGTTGPIGDSLWHNTGIDMVQGSVVLAQASALSAGGSSFTIGAPGSIPPHISASSSSLSFDYTVGGATPAAQSVTFTNTGAGILSWSASSDSPAWLSCSPTSGGSGGSTSVSVSPGSLAPGIHTGHVVVSASGADNTPVSIPVTLTVHAATPPPDTTPPSTVLDATPLANAAGWNSGDVAVGLHAADNPGGSGVSATFYTLDAVQSSYATTFTISAEGIHALGYWSVDASGNVEPTHPATIRIDKTPPSLSLDATATYTGSGTIHATAGDSLSGLSHVDMRLDGGAWSTVSQLLVATAGTHTVDARAFDLAGNERDASATFAVVGPPPPPPPVPVTVATATSLSTPSSGRLRRSLKLTGTVAPSAAPGSVLIVKTRLVAGKWRGAGTAMVPVSGGRFSYTFKPTVRGSWHLGARYVGSVVGSTTYAASSSAIKRVRVR